MHDGRTSNSLLLRSVVPAATALNLHLLNRQAKRDHANFHSETAALRCSSMIPWTGHRCCSVQSVHRTSDMTESMHSICEPFVCDPPDLVMAPTESLDAFGGFAGPASKQFYVATFSVEVCVFAAFLISYVIGTWCLFFCAQSKHPLRPLTVVLFVANTVMLWLAVAHMALDACGAVRGFTEGPPLFDAIKFVIYVLETLIGSSFMIYRLYRVYSRRWRVIIIPSVLLVAAGIIGISSTFLGVPGFYMSAGFYSLELMVDVISSIMILARVKEIGCDSQPTHARNIQMWRVIEALVQSTAITSAASMSLVITFVNSTYIGYPTCLNVLPPLIALVFSLTVLRIALNSGRKATRSESGHSWGISDHGSTMATAEMSSSTLEDAEEKEFTLPIYVSTTTIVQHDLPTHPGFSSNTIHIY